MSPLTSHRLRRVLERVIYRINELSETAIDPDDILNDSDYEPSDASTVETEELSVVDDPPECNGLNQKQMKSLTHSIVKKNAEVFECSVCLENMKFRQHIRSLTCDHKFHKRCIDSWLVKDKRCPICRCDQLTQRSNTARQIHVADSLRRSNRVV